MTKKVNISAETKRDFDARIAIMKKVVIIAVFFLVSALGGVGALWYAGMPPIGGQGKRTGQAPEGQKVDDLKEVDVEKIRARKSRPADSSRGKKEEPYEAIDYSDPDKRLKARRRVIGDVNAERDETIDFLKEYNRKTREQEERATAIERWLSK